MPKQTALGAETLQRDAAALFSFVDSIYTHCHKEDDESPVYTESSRKFFGFIRELSDATKAYLNAFASSAPSTPRLYQAYRQKLDTIRSSWLEFHFLIKSAVDADTLSFPYTLVQALTEKLNTIPKFKDIRFAIFHFDELNYLEVPVSAIKTTTGRLRGIVPESPEFPRDLGLIGIPYSQSSSLYLNLLISHEMGHFVFQEMNLKDELLIDIGRNLEQVLGSELQNISSGNLDWSKDRLASWSEELFCDLFAVWLIGPCYSLASVELFGLTTILDPSQAIGYSATAGSVAFFRSHPADLFRVKRQVSFLEELGWWNEIDSIKSHYIDVLRSARAVADGDFAYQTTEQRYADETLQAFLALAPRVGELVRALAGRGGAFDTGLASYRRFSELIGQYLSRVVVPSSVFDGKDHWYPDTNALLNSSMKFYLESLDELIHRIKDEQVSLAGDRSRWMKRVEELTTKAIEDRGLLIAEKGAVQDGGAFKRADLRSPESTNP